jgi:UDP-glucose 4-epimerase
MNKILITGGAGFIGSSLAEKLLEDFNNFVVIIDNLSTGNLKKLPNIDNSRFKFINIDVNDRVSLQEVMLSYKFDFVFHYAAMVGVKRTLENPVDVLKDIDGIHNIVDLSKNTGVKRIFYSSSSEIYGESIEFPQNEQTTPLNSRLPYAIVKNIGEAYLGAYHQKYGLNYTIFRFFNTYGPKQSRNFVISKFLYAASRNEDITIYGDGLQSRTFCYIDDNINATYNAFKRNLFVNDVVNIGSDVEISIKDLAQLIIDITGSHSKIVYVPALEDGDMHRRLPDISKMREKLWDPKISLEKGILNILEKGLFELQITS